MPHSRLPLFQVTSTEFDTRERFERWRVGVAGAFEVTPTLAPDTLAQDDGFGFGSQWWRLGALLLGDSVFDAHQSVRSLRHVRSDQLDHYRLVLRTDGELCSEADGLRQIVRPGEIVITDMSRPETLIHGRGSDINLMVPREMLDEALPRPLDLHGVRPNGVGARLLVDHLRSLAREAPGLEQQCAPQLNQATLSLIAACLLPNRETLARAAPVVQSTVLRQMCRYIELHLSEPELSADELIGFFKVSRASLYRMFEPMGGVASFVKERRLARMHAVLASTGTKQSIGRLAEDTGFRSTNHFSRAFREQYGYSPKDVQKGSPAALAGKSLPAPGSLVAWMRALRD